LKIIEIVITQTGETRVETKGFTGSDCQQATKALESALGLTSHEQLTGEFYLGVNQQSQTERQ